MEIFKCKMWHHVATRIQLGGKQQQMQWQRGLTDTACIEVSFILHFPFSNNHYSFPVHPDDPDLTMKRLPGIPAY